MIYDISPPISPELGVWPGELPISTETPCSLSNGDSVTVSVIKSTVHLGAHTDAPSHYIKDGPSIEDCILENYIGLCQIIKINCDRRQIVKPKHINVSIHAQRILIFTGTFPDPTCWNNDFAALSPELIDFFYDKKVKLVGVDTPSVDLFDSKTLPVHNHFFKRKMSILEGLVLQDVPEGIYELIALPLRLVGVDASPVRAILRELKEIQK